jgi:predicted RNA-binding Zn-ribbon protein involved in translation (DUF1610 family)
MKCRKCGEEVEDGKNFCGNCGVKIKPKSSKKTGTAKDKKRPVKSKPEKEKKKITKKDKKGKVKREKRAEMEEEKPVYKCPDCGSNLVYVEQYSRHFCETCQIYPELDVDYYCKTCNNQVDYVEQYQQYWCHNCGRYVEPYPIPKSDEKDIKPEESEVPEDSDEFEYVDEEADIDWDDDEEEDEPEPIKTTKCPRCKSEIEVAYSEDKKVRVECPSCGAKGKIKNPYLQ